MQPKFRYLKELNKRRLFIPLTISRGQSGQSEAASTAGRIKSRSDDGASLVATAADLAENMWPAEKEKHKKLDKKAGEKGQIQKNW